MPQRTIALRPRTAPISPKMAETLEDYLRKYVGGELTEKSEPPIKPLQKLQKFFDIIVRNKGAVSHSNRDIAGRVMSVAQGFDPSEKEVISKARQYSTTVKKILDGTLTQEGLLEVQSLHSFLYELTEQGAHNTET